MNLEANLQEFGFSFDEGGPHLARTMMLDDLASLLSDGRVNESCEVLRNAIECDNVLGKPSAQSRKLALRHLTKLYVLDRNVPLYHAFSFLWKREPEGRPLLAVLVAYVRDVVLRSSATFILDMKDGQAFERETLEAFIDGIWPSRFSPATLKSTAQNVAGTWTQSGHLRGRVNKSRQLVQPTAASVTLALLLGYVRGDRGQLLFESEYIKLLDCKAIRALELAESAGRKDWIDFKRIGSVIEVSFPRLLDAPTSNGPAPAQISGSDS